MFYLLVKTEVTVPLKTSIQMELKTQKFGRKFNQGAFALGKILPFDAVTETHNCRRENQSSLKVSFIHQPCEREV